MHIYYVKKGAKRFKLNPAVETPSKICLVSNYVYDLGMSFGTDIFLTGLRKPVFHKDVFTHQFF